MKQTLENFDIDETHEIVFLEENAGHKLYQYGILGIITPKTMDETTLTPELIRKTFKTIRSRLLNPTNANDIIGAINFKMDESGHITHTWYTREHSPFDRIRRITGYLVGTVDRFNDAKRQEESQRVKHSR